MHRLGITVGAALLIQLAPALAEIGTIVRSSEQTSTALCLANERPFKELRLLCDEALSQTHLTKNQRRHARYVLGNALSELEQHEAARETLIALLDDHPDYRDAMEVLAWDYWLNDEYEPARAVFLRINAQQPTSESMAGLANIQRRFDRDPLTAFESIKMALLIDPEYTWALRERGWIEIDLGLLDQARASFLAALDFNNRDAAALRGASYAASEAENYEEALSFINKAIELNDRSGWAFSHRAYVLRYLDRNAQAITEAKRSIELRPKASDGYLQKMLAHRDLGQINLALETAQNAYEAGVKSSLLRYWHADILSDDAQLPDALNVIEAAIAEDQKDGSYHELRSFILLEMGKHADAIAASRAALDNDPKLSFAPFYGALASYELGEQDAGLVLIKQAIENDLPKQQMRYFLGFLVGKGLVSTAVELRLSR